MRILFFGLFLVGLAGLGLFSFQGFATREAPLAPPRAGARAEVPAAPPAPAGASARAPETVGAVAQALEAVRQWLPDATSGGEAGATRGGRVYYQWTDTRGSVHIVQRLEDVPAEWRDRVGRIEVEARPERAPAARSTARRVSGGRTPPAAVAAGREVVVYSTTWCGWCRKTLAWLDARGIDYENRDIEASPSNREELIRKAGRASIPVVEIDGELVRGFDPGRMQALLGG